LYDVRENLKGFCEYWLDDRWFERFKDVSAILYRDQVTNTLFDRVRDNLNGGSGMGIMLKGPQGIGKSHSLVNLVVRLLSTEDYLVTFMPDCDNWKSGRDLVKMIYSSFGAAEEDVGIPAYKMSSDDLTREDCLRLINAIDEVLHSKGKQWVLIFDQVNRVFKGFDHARIPFPYDLMKRALRPARRISIMSASANNEMGYVDTLGNFEEEIHVTRMTEDEAATLFQNHPALAEGVTLQSALDAGGAVPLYVKKFLDNPMSFQDVINGEVGQSIQSMKKDPGRWEIQMESIIFSVLEVPGPKRLYDQKYLIRATEGIIREGKCLYEPLFPAVLQAYRTNLWDEIMKYISREEAILITVLLECQVTNDVVGRLFELLVIQRTKAQGTTMIWKRSRFVIQAGQFQLFYKQKLPSWPGVDGLWVPWNSNFPAIDFFVKSDSTVFAFQAHISTRRDVTPKFAAMCKEADWFTPTAKNRQVVLVYLSPNNEAKKLVDSLVKDGFYLIEPVSGNKRTRDQQRIHLLSLTCSEITGLERLTFDGKWWHRIPHSHLLGNQWRLVCGHDCSLAIGNSPVVRLFR
jgi:hypothetical protein